MAINLLLYPPDFPAELIGEDDDAFALENAVATLRSQSRDTALKQAHTRRISGQNEIQNQNKLVRATPRRLPLSRVGQRQIPTFTLQGTGAFISGGRGHSKLVTEMMLFSYSNEHARPLGIQSSEPRVYTGTLSNATLGYFCGGKALGNARTVVEEFSYAKLFLRRTAQQISQARSALAGIGNSTVGSLLGGIVGTVAVRTGDLMTYATGLMTGLGNNLPSARSAPHNGTGTPALGYLYGGSSTLDKGAGLLFSVDEHTFSNQTTVSAGVTLANAHYIHAATGSTAKGYLLGGVNQTAAPTWFSNVVTAFTYSGKTHAVLAGTLGDNKTCMDGAGSNLSGYGMGGDTAASNWTGTNTIDRINYSSDAVTRLGSMLAQPIADCGAVSDYGAGFI